MGTGYTRNDSSNNIADGNIINASDFDGEFDAIVTAFSTSGHTHDGTAAEGGAITTLGPAQQLTIAATSITPSTDDAFDLGSSGAEFKDLYIDGVAYIDAINFNGTAISATAAELNIMDGDTSASTGVTIATSDKFIVNDGGTPEKIKDYKMGREDGSYQTFYENGNKHMVGQIKDIQEEGTWECYYSDGSLRFRGEYKNGVGEGPWEFYFSNGQLSHKGTLKDDKWHGDFVYFDENGKVQGKTRFEAGSDVYESAPKVSTQFGDKYKGEYNNKKQRHGQGDCMYKNGDTYSGSWKEDQRHGKGTMRYVANDETEALTYTGTWKKDKRDGKGNLVSSEQSRNFNYSGDWKDDEMHGKGSLRVKDSLYNGEFIAGKKNGFGKFKVRKLDL